MSFRLNERIRAKNGFDRETWRVKKIEGRFMWIENPRGHTECVAEGRWNDWEPIPGPRVARKKLGRRLEL